MDSSDSLRLAAPQGFALQGMTMRYSVFVPRLYNLCLSLGFTAGKIMPSRAFCSDESQGCPAMMIGKHFGVFPFDHGRVGGVVATTRHGPHAHHGKDLLLIQASHVGYDPATQEFGSYRRYQTEGEQMSTSCGKIMATLEWYEKELRLAQNNIFLQAENAKRYVVIDNDLMRDDRQEGLVLHTDKIIDQHSQPDCSYSSSQRYVASRAFRELIGDDAWRSDERIAIGDKLVPELFGFRRNNQLDNEGHGCVENNLVPAMSWILTSKQPALTAAKVNSQMEFDRAYRSILDAPDYQERNLLFLSGLHIDVSPGDDQVFPLTKFVPWAAYHQTVTGKRELYDQQELNDMLRAQSVENPAQIDLEAAIKATVDEKEVLIKTC